MKADCDRFGTRRDRITVPRLIYTIFLSIAVL